MNHHTGHQIISGILLLLLTAIQGKAQSYTSAEAERQALRLWTAGAKVSLQEVERFGMNRCFRQSIINDTLFQRIYGRTFKKDCTISRTELRYVSVLHYTQDGSIRLGELICHKDISTDLVEIFRTLFDQRYPIERMVLADNYDADDLRSMQANNTSCFNFRRVAGSRRLSNHSTGHAIDINPLYNPYVRKRADGTLQVSPAEGRPYANRNKNFAYKIERGDACYRAFTKRGFTWGGNWKSLKDYQHFEKRKKSRH